jgi:probable DNA repair protein
MPSLDPAAALARGVTLVTPDNRLARTLIARHDAAMLREGEHAWSAARVLPWSVWVETLWREALEAGAAPPELRLLSRAESQFLWDRIVREDAALRDSVMDAGGPAGLAQDAWNIVHAWGAGGESWRAWRDAGEESDAAVFARWAERYVRELRSRGVLDPAELADALREWAPHVAQWKGRAIALAGFIELSPQAERVCESLEAAGMQIAHAAPALGPATPLRAAPATPREELRAALAWARRLADESPDRFIGIAVPDLGTVRDEVRALADDVLCPMLAMPGQAAAPRPYSISLGTTLAAHPVVSAALAFISLAHGAQPRAGAAALMRSPYWSGAWTERAGCERAWIEDGRSLVSWSDFASSLSKSGAVQLRVAIEGLALRAHSPAAWVAQWRTLLEACGWPAGADEQGAGYEARQAWERLLDAFGRIGHVEARLSADEAPSILRAMAMRTKHQPTSPPTAIAVMDLEEASALSFDALWVTGLSAQRWPPAPQANPLLPLAWQRERRVPGSSPERELAHAERVTERLARSAPRVVMSAPRAVEDYESAPSALIGRDWPLLDLPKVEGDSALRIAATAALEAIRDDVAPPFDATDAPGGAGTLASQSTCPFQAMARRRLRVEPWPDGYEALSYAERGQLVHATMAAFWQAVGTHARLASLDRESLAARAMTAAEAARKTLPPERWRLLPRVVAEAELERIAGIVRQWVDQFERPRPPFEVTGIEQEANVTLAGLAFRLKLDRVDRLADGSAAIIDYKTGNVDRPRAWFADRPRSPQLGVYLLALRSQVPPIDVSAVAYARLKAGNVAVLGVAADVASWPALDDAAKLREPSGWGAVEAWWQQHMTGLAAEFRDGVATVTPRDPPACCRACRLQPLCRIGESGQGGGAEEDSAA